MWTRLSFSDISCSELRSKLCIQQDIDVIVARFKEVDIAGKVAIKSKLHEIAYPDMTSMCPPVDKVKTKGSQKEKAKRFALSTKRDPSYFEHVDKIHSMHDSNSNSKTQLLTNPIKSLIKTNEIQMLDQFHPACHPYIIGVTDVKADGHCGYRTIVALLGMGEESWSLVRMDLYRELCEWRDEYAVIVGGSERLEQLKKSLLDYHTR